MQAGSGGGGNFYCFIAEHKLDEKIMYGDNYWKIEFNKMIDFANTKNKRIYMVSKIIFILMIKV